MTSEIVVRDARDDEAKFVMEMTRHMVLEMEHYGGRVPAASVSAWDNMTIAIANEVKEDSIRYLIAETVNRDRIGVAGAGIVTLAGALEPKKAIHLSVLYVLPGFRRAGVGAELLSRALDWGRSRGSEYCTLTVLRENPAVSIYKKHGFCETSINMSKLL